MLSLIYSSVFTSKMWSNSMAWVRFFGHSGSFSPLVTIRCFILLRMLNGNALVKLNYGYVSSMSFKSLMVQSMCLK